MKRCADMVARMSEEIDGCLEGDAHDALMAHLETCAACRRVYDELTHTLSLMRAVPPKPAPPDMAARVRRRLEHPAPRGNVTAFINRPSVRMALAASIVLAVSFYALQRPDVRHESADVRRQIARVSTPEAPAMPPEAGPPAPGLEAPARDAVSRVEPDAPVVRRPEEEAARATHDGRARRELAEAPAMDRAAPTRRLQPEAEAERAAVARPPVGALAELAEADDALAVTRTIDGPPGRGARAAAGAEAAPPAAAAPPADAADVTRLAGANQAFAADMYRALAAEQDGNILFSPYSVHAALSMAFAGADGDTAREMATALRWPYAGTELPSAFRALNRQVTAAARAGGQTLNIANGLSLTGGDVNADYKALLRDAFSAEIFTGDLAAINAWAARKTDGVIDRILDALAPDSVCVLLNAIAFKGRWRDRFDPARTREAAFQLAPDRRIPVPMMHRTGHYRLLEADDYQALALPYQGDHLSMIIVLPRELDGLAGLERRLSAQQLTEWSRELAHQPERRVQVHLPRFKLETAYDLVPPCRRLGMRQAFATADFTGMGWPKGELWISQIVHKAVMTVDEDGTEAAAATAVEMQMRSAQPPEPVFRADHPFLFLIQEDHTGSILFIGRVREM